MVSECMKDKVVLVTGSTMGIGAAVAKYAAENGAKVMIHGRSQQRAEALLLQLPTDSDYVVGDLLDPSTPQKLVNATCERFGRIDCLINNAGIYPRTTLDSATLDVYERVMAVNFRAPLFLTQCAVRKMRQQGGGGTVVNIGSINAYCGEVGMSLYAPSKGALMTMTRNLGCELAEENIRVNALNVGWTLTENESALKQSQGFCADWERYIPKTFAPSGKLLRPDQVAKHAVFWASGLSAPAAGQVFDLEQYPMHGRNLIYTLPLDLFPKK